MEYYTIAGMVLVALIAILGVYHAVKTNTEKSIEPIHELNVAIAKLASAVENMNKALDKIDQRVTKHGGEIEKCYRELEELKSRLGKIEIKVDLLHKEDK